MVENTICTVREVRLSVPFRPLAESKVALVAGRRNNNLRSLVVLVFLVRSSRRRRRRKINLSCVGLERIG